MYRLPRHASYGGSSVTGFLADKVSAECCDDELPSIQPGNLHEKVASEPTERPGSLEIKKEVTKNHFLRYVLWRKGLIFRLQPTLEQHHVQTGIAVRRRPAPRCDHQDVNICMRVPLRRAISSGGSHRKPFRNRSRLKSYRNRIRVGAKHIS